MPTGVSHEGIQGHTSGWSPQCFEREGQEPCGSAGCIAASSNPLKAKQDLQQPEAEALGWISLGLLRSEAPASRDCLPPRCPPPGLAKAGQREAQWALGAW